MHPPRNSQPTSQNPFLRIFDRPSSGPVLAANATKTQDKVSSERALARRVQVSAHKLMRLPPPSPITPAWSGKALYDALSDTMREVFRRTGKHGVPSAGSKGFRIGEALILAVKMKTVVSPFGCGPILLTRCARWVGVREDLEREREMEKRRVAASRKSGKSNPNTYSLKRERAGWNSELEKKIREKACKSATKCAAGDVECFNQPKLETPEAAAPRAETETASLPRVGLGDYGHQAGSSTAIPTLLMPDPLVPYAGPKAVVMRPGTKLRQVMLMADDAGEEEKEGNGAASTGAGNAESTSSSSSSTLAKGRKRKRSGRQVGGEGPPRKKKKARGCKSRGCRSRGCKSRGCRSRGCMPPPTIV